MLEATESSSQTTGDKSELNGTCCCAWCYRELDEEERASPLTNDELDEVICDACYRDEYEDECDRCGEIVAKTELAMNPGELIAFWDEVDGLKPGYYKVLRWPIYADGMIEGYVMTENLEYAEPLDKEGERAAANAYYPGGRLCCKCRVEIAKNLNP